MIAAFPELVRRKEDGHFCPEKQQQKGTRCKCIPIKLTAGEAGFLLFEAMTVTLESGLFFLRQATRNRSQRRSNRMIQSSKQEKEYESSRVAVCRQARPSERKISVSTSSVAFAFFPVAVVSGAQGNLFFFLLVPPTYGERRNGTNLD
jgi:hypothetical protein